MTTQDEQSLKNEIQHIFDSGANEMRVLKMVKSFIEKRGQTLYIRDVSNSAFGVYTDSVGFDLASENTLMAVFRTEKQANKFGRMMWGSMFYVEPMDSPHFTYDPPL